MDYSPLQHATEQQRAQRRSADRERLRHAAEQLLSPEGWARWVQARATFRGYSATNCVLLAQQCHERGIVPQRVCGLYGWRKLGRRVRKGETGLRVSAPVVFRAHDEDGKETRERRVYFKTAYVFELSQTETVPGIEPRPLGHPCEPLNGSSHAHMLPLLGSFAYSLGYSVSFTAMPGWSRGLCDVGQRRIVVDARAPANTQVRTLLHECVHALGIDYQSYPRDEAEVIADTVTFIVSAGVGLAVDADSVPYVASWGKSGAIAVVTKLAQTIDELSRRIENSVLPPAGPA